jgi:eukaryotic-like serine/threonine-protein kinase
LIPARLKECEIPDRLRHLQWVDLFLEGGYERLYKALLHSAANQGSESLKTSAQPRRIFAQTPDALVSRGAATLVSGDHRPLIGKIARSRSGAPFLVTKYLGTGGETEVYTVTSGAQEFVLKWYFSSKSDDILKTRLEQLVAAGSPSHTFVSPFEMVSIDDLGFGFIASRFDPRFRSIADLLRKRIAYALRVRATAAIQFAESYESLHRKSWCYRDLSFGNHLFDPLTGDVLIQDYGNISRPGECFGVLGTPRFMAPEILSRGSAPTLETDLFSMAILFFYLFVLHHPFEGRRELSIACFDLPAMEKLYGEGALFIFDPDDRSNEPVRGVHDIAPSCWSLYPNFLRAAFTKVFTHGVRNTSGRLRAAEWRSVMIRLRDCIFLCESCQQENFVDEDKQEIDGEPRRCCRCQHQLSVPLCLRVAGKLIVLERDVRVFAHHLREEDRLAFSSLVGSVAQDPENPTILGLKNLSEAQWAVRDTGGKTLHVEPGHSVRIKQGLAIDFGGIVGEIGRSSELRR